MRELTEKLARAYEEVCSHHISVYRTLSKVRGTASTGSLELEELLDLAFLCRAVEETLTDLRKESSSLLEHLSQIACLAWTQKHINNPTGASTIRGDLCSGSPKTKTMVSVPRRGSDHYERFLRYFGVPEQMIEGDTMRPYWPGLVDHITELVANGATLPPGCDPRRTYTLYKLTMRSKHKSATPQECIDAARKEN